MNNSTCNTLHIIDGDFAVDANDASAAYWSRFSSAENCISLPNMVEKNGAQLKKEFFNCLNNFSQIKLKDKTLLQLLQVEGDFSFWWASLLNEKSLYKSPWIYDLFKVMLLRKLIVDAGYSNIHLYTDDAKLSKLILELARELHLTFACSSSINKKINWSIFSLRTMLAKLPYVLQSFLFLCRFIYKNRVFIFDKKIVADSKLPSDSKQISIVSYFPNIDFEKYKKGEFYSHYWGDLSRKLLGAGYSIDWTFLYAHTTSCSPKQAAVCANSLRAACPQQRFTFLHNHLRFMVFCKAIKMYFKLYVNYAKRSKLLASICRELPNSTNYYFFRKDLAFSVIGKTAMENCLFYAMFAESVAKQKTSSACLYLMENHAWEKCLVYNWRNTSHKPIIGYSHASIRYFDLRYFGFELESNCVGNKTLPTKVAVCGPDSVGKMSELDLPASYFLQVEATRYTYLHSIARSEQPTKSNIKDITILCLTDIKAASAAHQFRFLYDFFIKYRSEFNIRFIIKPHPFLANACDLAKRYLLNINYSFITNHLRELNEHIDVAFIDSDSGAAIDIAYMGIPFVLLKNPRSLNLSPLLKYDQLFIESIDDFYNIISNVELHKQYVHDVFHVGSGYFFIDKNLPRWQKLLESI